MFTMREKRAKRFVIQQHERQDEPAHWDLMLERGDCLETYRVCAAPELWHNSQVEAVKIFDHPLRFLTYEGVVNKGKGTVKIADAGTYLVLTRNDKEQCLVFSGRILKGEFTLTRIKKASWELRNKP